MSSEAEAEAEAGGLRARMVRFESGESVPTQPRMARQGKVQ